MIQGFIGNQLVCQDNVGKLAHQDTGLDHRSKRMSIAIHSTNDPLSYVKMAVKFPQFNGSIDQQSQVIKNLMTVNYATQLQQISSLPSIDVCQKFEDFSKRIRLAYQPQ